MSICGGAWHRSVIGFQTLHVFGADLGGKEDGEEVRDDGGRQLPRNADVGRQRRRALQRPPPRVPGRRMLAHLGFQGQKTYCLQTAYMLTVHCMTELHTRSSAWLRALRIAVMVAAVCTV